MRTSFRFVLTTTAGTVRILDLERFNDYFKGVLSSAFAHDDPVTGVKELKRDIMLNNSCEQIKEACKHLYAMHPRVFPIFLDALKMREDCMPKDMYEAFENILADTETEDDSFIFHTNFGECLFLDIRKMMSSLLAPYDVDLMGMKTKELFAELFI